MHPFLRPPAGTLSPRGDGARSQRLIGSMFVALFVLYALNCRYFFVDDEAIPFVYAQNLLDGYGLVATRDASLAHGGNLAVAGWSSEQGLRQLLRDVVPLGSRIITIDTARISRP